MVRKTPLPDVKILYGLAAGRCSFFECKIELVLENKPGEKKQIGQIAHIVAHSKKGPRSQEAYPSEKLDSYNNWILLCGTHHDIVDTAVSKYSANDLLEMKEKHEKWVQESLSIEVMNVSFAELEVTAKAILTSAPSLTSSSFTVTHLAYKMQKNSLNDFTHKLLNMGLSKSHEVAHYIEAQEKLDSRFAERLKAGFKNEYERLINQKIYSDALFEAMFEFASGNSNDFSRRAAGLTILTHLFEICEVFEP